MIRNYGNVFSTTPGKCFRFVTDGFGRPGQCTEVAVAHGTFKDDRGQLFDVDACEIHASDLESSDPTTKN